jgi:hypothetical protein
MNARQVSVVALVVCAVSDAAAVPLLLGSDEVPAVLGIVVAVLAALTLAAAYGVARGSAWGRHLAFGTRGVDVLAAAPALAGGVGAAETSAVIVTVLLSLVAVVALLRVDTRTVRTA